MMSPCGYLQHSCENAIYKQLLHIMCVKDVKCPSRQCFKLKTNNFNSLNIHVILVYQLQLLLILEQGLLY